MQCRCILISEARGRPGNNGASLEWVFLGHCHSDKSVVLAQPMYWKMTSPVTWYTWPSKRKKREVNMPWFFSNNLHCAEYNNGQLHVLFLSIQYYALATVNKSLRLWLQGIVKKDMQAM